MARNRGFVNVPVERSADSEILATPVEAYDAVVVAIAFVILFQLLGFADQGAQGVAHLATVQGGVAAKDFV